MLSAPARTPEGVRAVARFSTQFGMTKAWRGLRALDTLLTGTYAGSVYA